MLNCSSQLQTVSGKWSDFPRNWFSGDFDVATIIIFKTFLGEETIAKILDNAFSYTFNRLFLKLNFVYEVWKGKLFFFLLK
jgi:hypothetical protein